MVEWLQARTLESDAMDSNLSLVSLPMSLLVRGFIRVLPSWDCCKD